MTTSMVQGNAQPSPRPFLGLQIFATDPLFAITGAALLLMMVPTAAVALLDAREFQGVDIWDKPLKFQFALGVYLLTLSAFASFFPEGVTRRPGFRIYAVTVVAAILIELTWIGGAAALGIPSHFNTTELGSLVYRTMGGLALWLTGASMVYGIIIARSPNDLGMPLLRYAVAAGLILTLPLTAVTAGYMSASGGHWVGGALTDAGGFFLMGWSRTGGDLRVAHFFATHAMHIVPLASLALALVIRRQRRLAVALAALGTVALVGYTFVQALAGEPFLAFIA